MPGMRRSLALALLVAAAPAAAATFVATSVEQTARASDAVVRGTVISKASRMSPDGRGIVTDVEIAVASAWKGEPEATVRVTVRGGEVGNLGMRVDAAPSFQDGEEVVVFLARRGQGWRVGGNALGKSRVQGREVRPSLEGARILPRPLARGERLVETMSVDELEARVRGSQ
jgi:hypothetical protein